MTVRVNKPAFNLREKLSELTSKFGLKGTELARAETVQDARDLISAGRKNLVINGDLRIWQRGTGPSTIPSASAFLADRWDVATNGTAELTQEQSTDSPPGFAYSLKVSPSVADTLSGSEQSWITYKIEAQDMTFLNWGSSDGIPITISFWTKSNDTGNRCLWLFAQDADDHIARQFNNSTPNTWEKFTFTIPPNSLGVINNDNGIGIYLRFVLDSGSTAANGTLPSQWTTITSGGRYGTMGGFLSNTANEFYITGVQVEAGKNATDFEYRSYGEELALCQRYYYRISSVGNPSGMYAMGFAYTSGVALLNIPFAVEMRALPSSMDQSGTATDYRILQKGVTTVCDQVPTISDSTKTNATVNMFDTGGYTQGQGLMGRWSSGENGYLGFNAEL